MTDHNELAELQPDRWLPEEIAAGREAARRYRVGSRLKVDADMSGIRLTFSNVAHIHLLEQTRQEAA